MGAARAKTTQDPMRLHISLNGAKISWHCGSRQQLEIAQVSILLGFVQLLNRIQRVFYSTASNLIDGQNSCNPDSLVDWVSGSVTQRPLRVLGFPLLNLAYAKRLVSQPGFNHRSMG